MPGIDSVPLDASWEHPFSAVEILNTAVIALRTANADLYAVASAKVAGSARKRACSLLVNVEFCFPSIFHLLLTDSDGALKCTTIDVT